MPEVVRDEFTFTSADGKTPIRVLSWTPTGELGEAPRAIVQLAHGMEEHIERYDDFARFLAAHGFAVCGNDHIGHGKSVSSPDGLSKLPLDGANVIIQDMHTLQKTFSKGFPEGTPYILFGHSMGSFAARYYVAAYGRTLAGAIYCGTGEVPTTMARLGSGLARLIAKFKGVDHESSFIYGLADGAYSKAIPDARTNLDWLNSDPDKVDEYIADPLCGKMFNLGGYASLLDLTAASCNSLCARATPSEIKILVISGADDPVGGTKGAGQAAKLLTYRSGAEVELKLYDGMRHEILKEPGYEQVYADVLVWLEGVVEVESQKAAIKVRLKPVAERTLSNAANIVETVAPADAGDGRAENEADETVAVSAADVPGKAAAAPADTPEETQTSEAAQ